MVKPHRLLANRLGSYTDEAKAFVRRRRHHRRPYVRIQYVGGDAVEVPSDSASSEAIRASASSLIARSPGPIESGGTPENR
jgi:hypothetical protein